MDKHALEMVAVAVIFAVALVSTATQTGNVWRSSPEVGGSLANGLTRIVLTGWFVASSVIAVVMCLKWLG
jgi:hypothetical protein